MSLAIVGAGISGLAAAWALRESAVDVHLFEKSRGVSGRAATRGRQGCRYDHGANYFKTDSVGVERIVRHVLPSRDLVDLGRAVWTFDRAGRIEAGDPEANRAAKWTYRNGISTLGKLLLEGADVSLHTRTRVRRLEQTPEGWSLVSTEDQPGHVPEGRSLLVVQMTPAWSTEHYDLPLQDLLPEVTERVAELLGADPGQPAWSDLQRWRYALPDRAVDAEALGGGAETGLFFAGDALVGQGRVPRALETGLDAARRIRAYTGAR